MESTIQHEKSRGLWSWAIVKVVVATFLIYLAILFLSGGFDETSTRQAIRLSARLSVVLFCLAFAASAIHRWLQTAFSWWLLMNRKFLGISFALIHLIHLSLLVALQQFFHPVFELAKTSSLIGGGLAYLFLVLMLLTSFPVFSKYLSKRNWVVLHTVGGWWIWAIFFRSYFKRVLTEWEYAPLVALLVAVALLRLVFRKKKMAAPA